MRRATTLLSLLLAAVGGVAVAEDVPLTRVTYFTGSTIYFDAGHDEGLAPGLLLVVRRGAEVVATCRVVEVSSHRASCALEQKLLDPLAGDTATYNASSSEEAASSAEVPAPAPAPVHTRSSARDRPGLRGRVGVRYLLVRDNASSTGGYTQPALDLRLDGSRLGGSAWGIDVDARARRTTRDLADGTTDREQITKVYRAAVSRRGSDDPWSFTVGRQFSTAVAAVSVFDGVSVEYAHARWSTGLFSGTQPDPEDYGYASDLREHGVYFQVHGQPTATRRWFVSTGLVGSYAESEVNREFLYVQTRYGGPRLSVYATEEVDYNRGWKVEAGESTVSSTATFASLTWRAGDRVDLRAGYDNRRDVRLYRDFVNPETEFDDSYREGAWAGVTTRLGRRFNLGLDARTHGSGSGDRSDSATLSFGANRLWKVLDFRARSTRYESDVEMGWLHALTSGVQLGRIVHLQLGGGVRQDEATSQLIPQQQESWINMDIDLALGRHWYVILSVDRTMTDDEDVDQLYSGLTYRF